MKPLLPSPTVRLQGRLLLSIAAMMLLSSGPVDGEETLVLRQGLAIAGGGRASRSPVHTDAIEAEIISGKWQRPVEGDRVEFGEGTSREWHSIHADTNGWFGDGSWRGGYAFVPMVVETNCVMLLEAAGDDVAYVNGELRAGDPYQYGYLHLPVALHAGTNDLLFRCSRGRLKVALATPPAPAALDLADQTLPDLIAGEKADAWGAVVVLNATAETRNGLVIRAAVADQHAAETPVPSLPPLSARKVGFRLRGKAPAMGDTAPLALTLFAGKHQRLHSAKASLRLRRPDQTQKRTFISEIDGSVQVLGAESGPADWPYGPTPSPVSLRSRSGC